MSNAGTWLVGRLQTERDKARVLDGLSRRPGGTDVAALDAAIGGSRSGSSCSSARRARSPQIFATRWAMSYLRGPLTKDQIASLMKDVPRAAEAPPDGGRGRHRQPPLATSDAETPVAPAVAERRPGLTTSTRPRPGRRPVGAVAGGTRLRAFVAARVSLRYDDTTAGIDEAQEFEALYGPLDGGLDLDQETVVDYDDRDLGRPTARRGPPTFSRRRPIGQGSFFKRRRDSRSSDGSSTSAPLEIFRNKAFKLTSRPGETRGGLRTSAATRRRRTRRTRKRPKSPTRLKAKQDRLQVGCSSSPSAASRSSTCETKTRARRTSSSPVPAPSSARSSGGRRSTRSISGTISGASSRRGMTSRAAERRRTAEERVTEKSDDLQQLEQELLDKVSRHRRRVAREGRRGRRRLDPARGDGRPRRSARPRLGAHDLARTAGTRKQGL